MAPATSTNEPMGRGTGALRMMVLRWGDGGARCFPPIWDQTSVDFTTAAVLLADMDAARALFISLGQSGDLVPTLTDTMTSHGFSEARWKDARAKISVQGEAVERLRQLVEALAARISDLMWPDRRAQRRFEKTASSNSGPELVGLDKADGCEWAHIERGTMAMIEE
ncbi:MAG: hypothetical protein M1837_006424 [Sclerophora amabilis]|nr:MAG: hypothetical protein M1837_006424 [Sclerophora amabilis]